MSAMRTCSGLIGPSPSEAANASALPAIDLYAGGNIRPLDSAGIGSTREEIWVARRSTLIPWTRVHPEQARPP
jgi:hypothetical protein